MKKTIWRENCKNHAKQSDFLDINDYDVNSEDLFKLHIPKSYKKKIDFNNPNDPLLMQVMPSKYERYFDNEESSDPVGDLDASRVKGLIHKYHGRVLLISTGICAINCRYCFRRNFPYSHNYASAHNWLEAVDYIKSNPEIHEVILSGGDPLMLSTKALHKLTSQLESIKHIKTLRIHTRMPLVTPSRITTNFLKWLKKLPFKKVMVLHSNHPDELENGLKQTIKSIAKAGALLLNQSVLLKGINDNAEVLQQLSHKLFKLGILPYYLNQLDKAKGTKHFQVSNQQAKLIHRQLLEKLPGYLVPKLVTEIKGKKNKSPLI
jgi:EF-P beta-lysylation protein EpmB